MYISLQICRLVYINNRKSIKSINISHFKFIIKLIIKYFKNLNIETYIFIPILIFSTIYLLIYYLIVFLIFVFDNQLLSFFADSFYICLYHPYFDLLVYRSYVITLEDNLINFTHSYIFNFLINYLIKKYIFIWFFTNAIYIYYNICKF